MIPARFNGSAVEIQAAERHQQVTPGRGKSLARQQVAKDHAPAPQQQARERLGGRGILGAGAQQRPAAGGVPGTRATAPTFAPPPLGVNQRAQILEPIGGDQPGRYQFPERVFDFAGQPPGPP
jgi:hypothetical protein